MEEVYVRSYFFCEDLQEAPFASISNNDGLITVVLPDTDFQPWFLMFTQVWQGILTPNQLPNLQATLTTLPGQQPSWRFMLWFPTSE